jgi:hypothetical protein
MRAFLYLTCAVTATFIAGCSCGGDSPARSTKTLRVSLGPDASFCVGGSMLIGPAPQAGYKYSWTPSTGLSAANVAQPLAKPTATTRYTLHVNAPDGSQGQGAITLNVHALPTAAIAVPSPQVCSGKNWALSGSGSTAAGSATIASYVWEFANGTYASGAEADLLASATTAGPVTLTVTDSQGCKATTSTTLTTLPNPEVSSASAVAIEPGMTATLSAAALGGTPPYQFTWTAAGGTCTDASCSISTSVPTASVAPSATTQYSVSVTDAQGCSAVSPALATVTVFDPLAAFSGTTGICAGDSIAIGQPATGGATPYTYAWSGSVSDPSSPSPMVSPTETTSFSELVTDALGITASASTTVNVFPDPGSASGELYAYPGASTQIGPTAVSGSTYAWTCNRGDCALSAADTAQPLASPALSTTYNLTASSGEGCTKSSSTTVWVQLQETSAPAEGDPAYPVSAMLQVQFDHPIAASSLTDANIQLTDAVSGATIPITYSFDSTDNVLTVHPPASGTSGYASGNDYTLTLTGGLTGVISDDPVLPNVFAGDVMIDYTTGAADTTGPTVIFRAPPANATGVPINAAIEATFSEAVDPATVTTANFGLSGPNGAVAGSVSYDFESHTAIFTPSANLDPTVVYTVRIANVADLSGNLGGDSWSFTTGTQTDTTAPSVIAVSPADGSTAVASTTAVSVTFSEPINPGSLTGFHLANASTGAFVGGSVTYNAATQVATFTPATVLDGNTTFAVQVGGVIDLAANVMSPAFQSTFKTMRTIFHDDFEHGTDQWLLPANGAGVSWGLATRSFTSPLHSLTDSPNGKYAANQTSIAQVAVPIDITGVNTATLEFAVRTRTEKLTPHSTSADYFYVDVSVDDGATWIEVDKPGTTTGWSGNGAWSRWTIPVSIPSGTNLSVRLRLQTNDKKNFDGVYIDDVTVQAP